jgi:hypothetical protein
VRQDANPPRAAEATAKHDAEIEQRVRAEIVEQLRVTSVAANLPPNVDPVAYLEKRLNFAWSEIDRLGNLAWDLAAERNELAQRTGVVDITRLDEAGTRTLCNNCGHEQLTPASSLSSTETGAQATADGQDANGPQDGSGARVPLPGRYGDDPIGRRLLDMPHEYAQHDEMDIPVCVCGWGWGHAVHGGPERVA